MSDCKESLPQIGACVTPGDHEFHTAACGCRWDARDIEDGPFFGPCPAHRDDMSLVPDWLFDFDEVIASTPEADDAMAAAKVRRS